MDLSQLSSIINTDQSEASVILTDQSQAGINLMDQSQFKYYNSDQSEVSVILTDQSQAEDLGRVDGVILDSPFHSFKRMLQSSVLSYVFDLEAFMQSIDLEFDSVEVRKKLKVRCLVFTILYFPVGQEAFSPSQNIPRVK